MITPRKKENEDEDPEIDVGGLEGDEVEVQLEAHRLLQHFQVFDDKDDTQEDDNGREDYFNETHV